MSPSTPHHVYQERLAARRQALQRLSAQDERVADLRLGVFLVGLALLGAVLLSENVAPWLMALPAVAFVALVVVHDAVLRRKASAALAVSYYELALMRLEGRFAGKGVPGDDFADPTHPYSQDLDIFGAGSLFELLCLCRTRAGEEALAAWLSKGEAPKEVRRRQEAVGELRDRLDLREDLALLGGEVRAQLHPAMLEAWGTAPSAFPPGPWGVLAWLCTLAAIAGGVAWALTPWGPLPLLGVAVLEGVLLRVLKRPLGTVLSAIQRPGEELRVLVQVLARLEAEPMQTPWLSERREALSTAEKSAATLIRSLTRRVTWLDAMRNQFFYPIGFLLMWPLHFGLAVERWRVRWGGGIHGWLRALGELEAANSLASFAFDHPDDPFPELVESQPPRLQATALAHPLMPPDVCVPNDVALGSETPSDDGGAKVWVVSGSNMSGKSTFLRTVGINVVLAQAGAPVRARSMRLTPLAIGATLRIQDSLSDGKSRFYAEISRLRQLMDMAGQEPPLLFLLDEILHGTNSHDRQIGAEAVVRSFIDAGAIGLVTTHDLALAQAAHALGPRGRNVHFVDELEDGRLVFDYRLRDGVVQKSNALELMRSVGLAV